MTIYIITYFDYYWTRLNRFSIQKMFEREKKFFRKIREKPNIMVSQHLKTIKVLTRY